MGRLVPEADLPDIRELAHRDYRMIYRLEEDRVTLLAVIPGSRHFARLGRMPWEIIE
jgi:hypothetical protein